MSKQPGEEGSPSRDTGQFRFNVFPRWLLFSGLPQVLGPVRWAVFRAIVELDHQTMGMGGRRSGPDGCHFRVPRQDIWAMTGLSLSSVQRSLADLSDTGLLTCYTPGKGRQDGGGGSWGTYGVNIETLQKLFAYVIPMVLEVHGGLLGVPLEKFPPEGIKIYGFDEYSVVDTWENLCAFRARHLKTSASPDKLQYPDPQRVAEICGL